jgi:NADP-dependent 3-hydroxy acid dehydrogenase YdfG
MRVFITGASSGIGEQLARRYAERGDQLGLVGRNAEKLKAVAASLPGSGHLTYALDVTDRDALIAAARDFDVPPDRIGDIPCARNSRTPCPRRCN